MKNTAKINVQSAIGLIILMVKKLVMGLRGFLLVASKIWNCVSYVFRKQVRSVCVSLWQAVYLCNN